MSLNLNRGENHELAQNRRCPMREQKLLRDSTGYAQPIRPSKVNWMTTCQFKNTMARLGELDTPEKFTLMMTGRALPSEATLNSLGFAKDIIIVIGKHGEESRQC